MSTNCTSLHLRSKRATLPPAATPVTISEPAKDTKGKKRAAPDSMSEDEVSPIATKKVRAGQTKKDQAPQSPKKSRYAAGPLQVHVLKLSEMQSRPNNKSKSATKKATSMPGPSRHDEDVEMMDDGCVKLPDDEGIVHQDDDGLIEHDKSDDDIPGEEDEKSGQAPADVSSESRRSLEETMAMFDFGRLGGMMTQLSSHLRTLLNNIKPSSSPTTRLL